MYILNSVSLQEFTAIKSDVSAMVQEIVKASELSHLRLLDEFTATEGEDHVVDVGERLRGLDTSKSSSSDSYECKIRNSTKISQKG